MLQPLGQVAAEHQRERQAQLGLRDARIQFKPAPRSIHGFIVRAAPREDHRQIGPRERHLWVEIEAASRRCLGVGIAQVMQPQTDVAPCLRLHQGGAITGFAIIGALQHPPVGRRRRFQQPHVVQAVADAEPPHREVGIHAD